VQDELDALFPGGAYRSARIPPARLEAVAHEDDRGSVPTAAQQIEGLLDRSCYRRLPLRVEAVDRLLERGLVEWAERDEGLDVFAVALPPMAIGDQSNLRVLRQSVDDVAQDAPGDDDLVLAFDLPPHRARDVEDQEQL